MKSLSFLIASIWITGLIFGVKLTIFNGHICPTSIHLDDTHIYIVEGSTISVYSLSNYKLLKRFGQRGEGPQEFKGDITINTQGDFILVSSLKRVSFFTKEGEYLKEFNLKAGDQFKPLRNNRFVGHSFISDNSRRFRTCSIYDDNFNQIIQLYKEEAIVPSPKTKKWSLFSKSVFQSLVYNNKIFIVGKNDFIIDVFDTTGKWLYEIKHYYDKVKISEKDKRDVLEIYRTRPSTKDDYDYWSRIIHFPDYFPAIRNIFTDGKNLYIRTYLQKNGKSEFEIIDAEGKLFKKVFLAIPNSSVKYAFPFMNDSAPYTFKDGKFYYMIETETDKENKIWELHVEEIK